MYLLTVAQAYIPISITSPSIIKHLLEQAHSPEKKALQAIRPLPTGKVQSKCKSLALVSKASQYGANDSLCCGYFAG